MPRNPNTPRPRPHRSRTTMLVAAAAIVGISSISSIAHPAPAHAEDDFFTIAVLPDVQYSSDLHPEILAAQVAYLRDNADRLNIALMLQEGDVVTRMGAEDDWGAANAAFAPLDGVMPIMFAAGNHDELDSLVNADRFGEFVQGFENYNVDGQYKGSYANCYRLLDIMGGKYLVMTLEFGAPPDVLAWAKAVAAEHSDRYVILVTHDYLNQNSAVRGAPGNGREYSLPISIDPTLQNPYAMWNSFVRVSPNVKFVFSGHVNTKTPGKPYAVGALKSRNAAGRYVYAMLANYQMYGIAGNGYLRLVRVYPSAKRVQVYTYSPWLNKWLTLAKDKFAYTDVNLKPLP